MLNLTALPGVQHAGTPETHNWRWAELAAQPDRPHDIHEEARLLVGSGWVEELVVHGEGGPGELTTVVEAARESGRRLRLVTSAPLADLPSGQKGERWHKDEDADSESWVLIPPARARWQLVLKRLLDLVAAAALLILLSPVLVGIALAIKLTSRGPVLYQWRVLGENGRPFVGFKFRTMVRNADALKPDLLHLNERRGPVFKIAADPRVTPLGRWLRKHSIDELPQLWSVLAGDMSLVGPRPVFPAEYQDFELWQMRKLSVKPGLTCLWQVEARHKMTEFSDWVHLDLHYIDTWSFWEDLVILLRTPIVIIKGTGH